jgi:hypothetical protein
LKNRRQAEWREMKAVELTGKDGSALNVQIIRYGDDPASE